MLAVIVAAIVALMTAPLSSVPKSCPADGSEASTTTVEPVGTGLLTAEEAEVRDQAEEQAVADAEGKEAVRILLAGIPALEFGVPVEVTPGVEVTITSISYSAPTPEGYPVIHAEIRYENRTDDDWGPLVSVLCSESDPNVIPADELPDSEVSLDTWRSRSFDEGTLSLVLPDQFTTAECGSGVEWLMLDLFGPDWDSTARWPICGS